MYERISCHIEVYTVCIISFSSYNFNNHNNYNFVDFPAVNWVVQMDCPEDVNAYIHRAGRTARFKSGGESLLVLLPSEEMIIERLKQRKIPINMIK